MTREPVTLSDVAALAGVSRSTASKVLNGGGRVSSLTRRRILDAAADLDFRPNALAKFFATGRSHTIGVLTTSAPSVFATAVLLGVQAALGAREMATLVYSVDFEPDSLDEAARRMRARQADGVLVIGDGLARPLHSITSELTAPVVYALGVSESRQDVSFTPDARMAGRLAAQHLLDLGRTRIAHVTGPRQDLAAHDRECGMREALTGAGLRPAGRTLHGDWTRSWGALAATRLLARDGRVDAVFCGNDQIATGMYMAVQAAGRRVPDDVAIVGVDNLLGMLHQADTLITTVDPNLARLGAAAAEHLLAAAGAPVAGGVRYLDCTLVLGESTVGPTGMRRLRAAPPTPRVPRNGFTHPVRPLH